MVNLLDALELQANEALVATSESLVGGRIASVCGHILNLALGCGLTEGGALVGVAVLTGGRCLAERALVVKVVATCGGTGSDTAVEEAVTTRLCCLGGVATDVLREGLLVQLKRFQCCGFFCASKP